MTEMRKNHFFAFLWLFKSVCLHYLHWAVHFPHEGHLVQVLLEDHHSWHEVLVELFHCETFPLLCHSWLFSFQDKGFLLHQWLSWGLGTSRKANSLKKTMTRCLELLDLISHRWELFSAIYHKPEPEAGTWTSATFPRAKMRTKSTTRKEERVFLIILIIFDCFLVCPSVLNLGF